MVSSLRSDLDTVDSVASAAVAAATAPVPIVIDSPFVRFELTRDNFIFN